MQPTHVLEVPEEDRRELRRWLRASTTRKSHAERARMVLLSTEGLSAEEIGSRLGVAEMTVLRWRRRYREEGVSGLRDKPRPGQPRKLSPEQVARILRLTTQRIPHEA